MTDARGFAIAAHGGQLYGGQPYVTHLDAVVQVLRDFDCGASCEQAGWLHDVVEDTSVELAEIRDRFGGEVASLVDAVTDLGATRDERNARIYAGICAHPAAAIVKVADRIANVEAAPPGSDHSRRYSREADEFALVVKPNVPEEMWARLVRGLETAR